MKQIVSNYSYSPATNVVTLSGVNIDADQLLLIVAPQVGRTLYNFASVTGTVSAGADTRVSLNASTAGLTTTSPLVIFYDDQASAQTVTGTVALDPASLVALENVTVTIGSSVTIAGTVTANITNSVTVGAIIGPAGGSCLQGISGSGDAVRIVLQGRDSAGNYSPIVGSGLNQYNIPIYGTVTVGNSVTIGSLPAISGTVTVGNSVTIGSIPAISGTVTANVSSTTVTVSSFPRPTWTDYSGSVVTANSAVTAVSTVTRSYLLAQVTTGQMFLNIGATCTTGNGVYFSAGQGFAWETSVPQGIVSIISSVTGTNYVLKDG